MPISDVFEGLSHADRLALVFTAIHDELAATSPPPPPPPLSCPSVAAATSPRSPKAPPQVSLFSTRPTTPQAKPMKPSATEGSEQRDRVSAHVIDEDGQSVDGGSVSPRHPEDDGERGGSEEEARVTRKTKGEGGQRGREGTVEVEGEQDQQGKEGADRKDDCIGRGSERAGVSDKGEGDGASSGVNRRVDAASRPTKDFPAGAVDLSPACPPDDGSGEDERRRSRRRPGQHRVIRGVVKASYVGPNVEALPIWGALDAIAGSSLLVDCRTPAQWRADEYQPTAQVVMRTFLRAFVLVCWHLRGIMRPTMESTRDPRGWASLFVL